MNDFLDSKALSRIKDLNLLARIVGEGCLQGWHQSVQRGLGLEFSQYRSYEPGDALNRIDWKLFARSDKYFVREAERESDTKIWILLDNSPSMSITGKNSDNSKLAYAKRIAASLAYIAYKQEDRCGYMSLGSQAEHAQGRLDLGKGQTHLNRFMFELEQLASAGVLLSHKKQSHLLQQVGHRSLVVVVSDFLQNESEITELIWQLRAMQNDVVAIQLHTDDEINLPYEGKLVLQDSETNEKLTVNANSLKKYYHQQRQHYQEHMESELARSGTSLISCSIDSPLHESIFSVLKSWALSRARG